MTLEIEERTPSPLKISITRLIAQNATSEISIRLLLENGEHREQRSLLITMEQYCEIQPQKGEISEETFDRLEHAAEQCRALRCGENLLSYGANSAQRLSQKLMRRGFSREVATGAAQALCEMGLIDEASDVRREVEKCLGKLWGASRIRTHLWSRGFASESLAVLPELLAAAQQIVENGIPQADFLRMKCSALGRRIRDLDSFDSTCFRICAYHFSGYDYFKFPEIYDTITQNDVLDFMQQVVTKDRCCAAVIRNKEV